ncbi:MAG: hypothetical protein LQ339_007434 [Xanthoria mediterranea]|nr:MAG: hypothetical protein LQ339_007434 [Xanthoria mediterranea]
MYLPPLALNFFLAFLIKGAIATPKGLAQPEAHAHEKRLVCNSDNVLNALRANSAAASPFCLTFGHVAIPTITVPKAGVTPTVTTTTSYYYKSYFPNGRYLESIAVPGYVSQYSATRVSSGCSCLLTSSTATVTAAPTMTTTTTETRSYTGSGDVCWTRTTVPGGYTVTAGDPRETIVRHVGDYTANAFNCCVECQIQLKGDCVAWAVVPGLSCTLIESSFIYGQERCKANGLLNGTIGVNLVKYPDALAGFGPCAGTVTTRQG